MINAKLEEMYGVAMFWFFTTIQAIIFDANNFCYRISQLTQLTSPERFDQMNYVEQREEFQTQIISGIYYHNAIDPPESVRTRYMLR